MTCVKLFPLYKNSKKIVSILIGLVVSWVFRDPISSSIFIGKSFSGRSILIQIIIFIGVCGFVSIIIYNIIDFLIPNNIVTILKKFYINFTSKGKISWHQEDSLIKTDNSILIGLLTSLFVTFSSIFILFIFEWIFFISKESFMADMLIIEKIAIFFQSVWIIFIISGIIQLFVWIIAKIISNKCLNRVTNAVILFLPGLFLSLTTLLVFDNFTYIILGSGIVNSDNLFRIIYAFGFLLLLNKFIYITYKYLIQKQILLPKIVIGIFFIVIGISSVFAIFGIFRQTNTQSNYLGFTLQKKPNIILLGADGLNASHLPMYGYQRDTTPFIDSISNEILISENNFSNAGSSAGSVISIFTSKAPFSTRVLNLPDALRGDDAYEHLPGLLNDIGYYNSEITYMRYVDAYLTNVRNGFDRINGRDINTNLFSKVFGKIYPVESQYFLDLVFERVIDRILHIFMIKNMPNPYLEINTPNSSYDYQYRIPELMELTKSSKEPFFFHVHLLGTHGPYYHTQTRNYSLGRDQVEKWESDFYDDAIIEFDNYVRELYLLLLETDRLDNTIIIIYSDHPQSRDTTERIPLIIRFPKGEYSGRIKENTQNIDISPTVLSYLGIPKPEWMEGKSLIDLKLEKTRLIYSATWRKPKEENQNKRIYKQFGSFRVISCDSYVEFSATTKKWSYGKILGHTSPCLETELVTIKNLQNALIQRIKTDGFPIDIMEENQ